MYQPTDPVYGRNTSTIPVDQQCCSQVDRWNDRYSFYVNNHYQFPYHQQMQNLQFSALPFQNSASVSPSSCSDGDTDFGATSTSNLPKLSGMAFSAYFLYYLSAYTD